MSDYTYEFEDIGKSKAKFKVINNNGLEIGEITFSKAGENMIIIDHTYVDKKYREQGVARKLVECAVNYAIENDKKVVPLCTYAKSEFEREPEYQKVIKK